MFVLQEYSEWKKEATDNSLPGVYIGLMDRLNSFSHVIVESTEELCAMLVSSYIEKVKETCKNGEFYALKHQHKISSRWKQHSSNKS